MTIIAFPGNTHIHETDAPTDIAKIWLTTIPDSVTTVSGNLIHNSVVAANNFPILAKLDVYNICSFTQAPVIKSYNINTNSWKAIEALLK